MTKKTRKVTFKAEELKYPSKEEIKYANAKCPKFNNFNFESQNGLILLFNGTPIKDASALENIYWWDIILLNRFGSLRGAYFDALTHYRRGFAEEHHNCSDGEMVNRLLFDNNAEIFYYFFFVSCDVMAQILNEYYKIGKKDEQVKFNYQFFNLIPDENVKSALKRFYKETEVARNTIRNGFTHRFPQNYPDYRSIVEENNSKKTYSAGSGRFITPKDILANMEDSLKSLSVLMIELTELMCKS